MQSHWQKSQTQKSRTQQKTPAVENRSSICNTVNYRGTFAKQVRLVAVACAHRDLMTALRTTAAQNGSSGLGLHAAKEPVGLRAAAAVGLKRTLRHSTE